MWGVNTQYGKVIGNYKVIMNFFMPYKVQVSWAYSAAYDLKREMSVHKHPHPCSGAIFNNPGRQNTYMTKI